MTLAVSAASAANPVMDNFFGCRDQCVNLLIFGYLDQNNNTLLACTRVSRGFSASFFNATSILYTNIIIRNKYTRLLPPLIEREVNGNLTIDCVHKELLPSQKVQLVWKNVIKGMKWAKSYFHDCTKKNYFENLATDSSFYTDKEANIATIDKFKSCPLLSQPIVMNQETMECADEGLRIKNVINWIGSEREGGLWYV